MGVRLGRVIAQARERARPALTQEALGALIGRGRVTVHNWEHGKSTPSFADRLLLASVLALDVSEMNRVADLDQMDGEVGAPPFGTHALERTPGILAFQGRTLPQAARLWVQKFLTELVAGDANEVEVENARALLSAPALLGFLQGGAARAGQLTDSETISVLEAIGEGAIRRVLRRRGRNV